MLGKAELIDRRVRPDVVVDVVGTGGDGANTVNISTMAALVVAATGVPVIKHGNRAASSAAGSADVLEALGVVIDSPGSEVARSAHEVGIGFCFAPTFHPALRFVGPTRRDLGVPTVFNILGPLANPAAPEAMLVGCSRLASAPTMATVLHERGVSALVVRGLGELEGLDEISTVGPTAIWDATGPAVVEQVIDTADWGIERAKPEDLRGTSAEFNADVLQAVLDPDSAHAHELAGAAIADAVAVNAAGALVAYDAAIRKRTRTGTGTGTEGSIGDRIKAALPQAREAMSSGGAWQILQRWVAFTADHR
jgi:anthranilate phosphoribosyltransferase